MTTKLPGAAASVVVVSIFMAVSMSAESEGAFRVTNDFVDYVKSAANPDGFGLREDGRFYPYSSPDGRRIGYRQKIADKAMYRDGWSREKAEEQLWRELETVAASLSVILREKFDIRFEQLARESQEILVDFAYSEGEDELEEDLVRGAAALNWDVLLDPAIYSRNEADWPDLYRNRAFIQRWGERGGIR